MSFRPRRPRRPTPLITALQYRRRWDDSEYQQDLDAAYDLREATRVLASDFAYGRHHWNLHYALTHGKHVVTDDLTAGCSRGARRCLSATSWATAPPCGAGIGLKLTHWVETEMVHNSVEYRYGFFRFSTTRAPFGIAASPPW